MSKTCDTCVFLMPGEKGELVCAGRSDIYGVKYEDIPEKYKNECDEYEMGLDEFIRVQSEKEKGE